MELQDKLDRLPHDIEYITQNDMYLTTSDRVEIVLRLNELCNMFHEYSKAIKNKKKENDIGVQMKKILNVKGDIKK